MYLNSDCILDKELQICRFGSSPESVWCICLYLQGYHGIEEEVFLSLPCVVGETGITHIFQQTLNDEEQKKLQHSAKTLASVIAGIQF